MLCHQERRTIPVSMFFPPALAARSGFLLDQSFHIPGVLWKIFAEVANAIARRALGFPGVGYVVIVSAKDNVPDDETFAGAHTISMC
jgi:hypothetical protein